IPSTQGADWASRTFFFSSRRRHTRFSRDWSSDVCSSDLGEWGFSYIYKCNYFLKYAQEKLDAGNISGSAANIDQYFGEVYFLRAFEYFKKLQRLGDFPIVTEPLENDMESLVESSKRQPRTE